MRPCRRSLLTGSASIFLHGARSRCRMSDRSAPLTSLAHRHLTYAEHLRSLAAPPDDLPDAERRPTRAARPATMLSWRWVAACTRGSASLPRVSLPAIRPLPTARGSVSSLPGFCGAGLHLIAWRVIEDRRRPALPASGPARSTSSSPAPWWRCSCWMESPYLLAVNTVGATSLVSVLADIFVLVALAHHQRGSRPLPGMITYSATEVSKAAKRLTSGTLAAVFASHGSLGPRRSRGSPRFESTSCRSEAELA